jgi:hypothetical protein
MKTYDLTRVRYDVVAMLPDGTKLQLTDLCERLGWEEGESEYAARLNLTVRNVRYGGGFLAEKLPLATVLYLYADWAGMPMEVWRGTIWDWGFDGGEHDPIRITGYDLVYYMQKSRINKYYAKGTGSKKMITNILDAYSIPLGTYKGPDVKHKKTLIKNKAISAALKGVLESAVDLGAQECILRAREGAVDVVPYGGNEDVFVISARDNLVKASDSFSMADLVTRVRVTGREDKKGRPKVVATLNGRTEFGDITLFQARGGDSLNAAKKKAQKILKDRGEPKRKLTIRAADMPAVRKGDLIYLEMDSLTGYFLVKSAAHDAIARAMTLEVKPDEQGK